MRRQKMIPVSRLHEMFTLDEQGRIFWKVFRSGTRGIGAEAGGPSSTGYRQVQIDSRLYFTHRIVFAMVNGRWPADQIDHINRIKSDNRPENLREASRHENCRNVGMSRRNSSGRKGVYWSKKLNKWIACITVNNKGIHIGCFKDLDEAGNAYLAAAKDLHGSFAGIP